MKSFLTFTSVIEALTGIGLLFFPNWLVSFLLQNKFDETGGIIIAMITGCAIFSLAIACWLFKHDAAALTFSKVLLVYNSSLVFVVLFATTYLKLVSIPFLFIGGFHLFQALWGLKLLLEKPGL